MGAFFCCECDSYSNSDDGCEECDNHHLGLVCAKCLGDIPDPVDEEEMIRDGSYNYRI